MSIQRTTQRCLLVALWLLTSSLFTACGSQGVSNSQISQAAPSVVLHDPSPGQLEVFVSVGIGGYDHTTREMTTINFIFTSKGRQVQFAGQEHLVCNDKVVSLHSLPVQNIEGATSTLAGQTFHCTYSAGLTSATLTFTVPRAPTLHWPQKQAQRSKNMVITYDTQGGTLIGIVALTPSNKAIARLNTPSAGQATTDTSTFPAGAAFASLKAGGMGIAMIEVIWV